MRSVRAAQGSGRGLGKSQKANLAFLHEAGHGTDGLFNRDGVVNAVLVVKVDNLHSQPAKAGFACLADVSGATVDSQKAPTLIPHDTEFCGQHHWVAPSLDGAANQSLIIAAAVDVGGVEQIDA